MNVTQINVWLNKMKTLKKILGWLILVSFGVTFLIILSLGLGNPWWSLLSVLLVGLLILFIFNLAVTWIGE